MKLVNFYYFNLFFFIIFFILSRFLFPFSDEPDLTVKAIYFLEFLNNFFNSYLDTKIFTVYNINNNCGIQANPLSAWALINQNFCDPPLNLFLINSLITFIFVLPIFLLIYIFLLDENNFLLQKFSSINILNSVLLTFLYGSFIYFLGLFSTEKISLLLSISIFLFIKNIFISLIIISLIFLIDTGSFLFVFCFYLIYLLIKFSNKFIHLRKIIIFLSLLLIVIFILKNFIFIYLSDLNLLGQKYNFFIEGMSGVNENNPFTKAMEKYPLILRLFHSIMSFVFMTSQDIKVPVIYLLNFFAISLIINKIFKNKKLINSSSDNINSLYLTISAIFVIIFFFLLFPLNTNGKNLIFLLPVFINFAMIYFDKFKIFYFMLINNFMLFYFLTLYRI